MQIAFINLPEIKLCSCWIIYVLKCYSASVDECGFSTHLGFSGIDIASPGGAISNYPHNLHCSWKITAFPDFSIQIHFDYFRTEENYDYFKVRTKILPCLWRLVLKFTT